MLCSDVERESGAKGDTDKDRLDDLKRFTEADDVFGPGLQVPLVWRAAIALACATMIEVDDLREVSWEWWGVLVMEVALARAAWQEQCYFMVSETISVDGITRPLYIEAKADVADLYSHLHLHKHDMSRHVETVEATRGSTRLTYRQLHFGVAVELGAGAAVARFASWRLSAQSR